MIKGLLYKWGIADLAAPLTGVVLITIVCFTLLNNREMRWQREVANLVALHQELQQARAELTTGQMLSVMLRAGDQSVRTEQVMSYLDQAVSTLNDALDLRQNIQDTPGDKQYNSALRTRLLELRNEVEAFKQTTRITLKGTEQSELDRRAAYQMIIQHINNINTRLLEDTGIALKNQDTVVRVSIGIWAGSLAGVLLLLIASSIRRTRTEVALRESEERFRAAFNQAAVGIAHVDIDGSWLRVNGTLCQMLGYSADELTRMRFQDITHADDLSKDVSQMHQLLAGEINTYVMEKRYIRKDGRQLWANLTVSLVRHSTGEPHYFIAVVENIDERKRIQADRDQLLERERVARSDAESAMRAKDHFLAVVSHELRTPLTPVTTGLDLLARSPEVMAEHSEIVVMMQRNIETESQIISDLLDVARLANNKLDVRFAMVDLHQLLRDVEQTFRISTQHKQVYLQLELGADHYHVNADARRMTQVFMNLVGNAIKFTPDGGRIVIRTADTDARRIRVEVEDNGIGLDPEVIQRLFKPFEQAEVNMARRYGGLGLGLSIARSIIELHGGTLSVVSQGPGKGACFIAEMPATAPVIARRQEASESNHGIAQKRILVVEDNGDTLQALVRLLKTLGHHVTAAQSATQGLEIGTREHFDLVLSDIGLPDFSGWELIRRLRQQVKTPAIALSGFGTEEDQKRSKEAGFSDHLTKPVDIIRLESAIRAVFENAART